MPLIDTLYPIGYGSRVLLRNDSGQGTLETSIATNIVGRFCSGDESSSVAAASALDIGGGVRNAATAEGFPRDVCVYVCVGKSQAQFRQIMRALDASGALKHTIVVAANTDQQQHEQARRRGRGGQNQSTLEYLAPFIGNSVAMQLRDRGCRVLAVYDNLSNHVRATMDFAQVIGRKGTILPQVEQVCFVCLFVSLASACFVCGFCVRVRACVRVCVVRERVTCLPRDTMLLDKHRAEA